MRTSRQLLKEARRALTVVLVFSGATNLLLLVLPIYTLQVFETVVPSGSLETLVWLTLMAGVAILALALLEMVRDRILLRAGLWLDHILGRHMLEVGLKATAPGTDLRQDARALATLRNFIVGGGLTALFDAPWVPIFLIALAALHPWMGIAGAAIAGLLVLAGLVQIAISARVATDGQRAQEQAEHWWTSLAGRGPLVGALGLASGAASEWERLNRANIACSYSLGKRTSLMRALARNVRLAAQLGIYGLGAWLVIGTEITPGALVAASILLSRALAPLEQSVAVFRNMGTAWSAYRRLRAAPDEPRSPRLGEAGLVPEGRLVVRDVTVYHPTRRTPALRNVSLALAPGELLAVVGPNGAGKSTLAALIAGALIPAAGSVQLDGIDVVRWQRGDCAPPIGYLPDEALLVEGSVHENINRFRDSSLISASRAAMRAGMHEILSSLPQGYDARIGPGGEGLALTERRAVALARALHGQPAIVVLDEPELGLDATSVRRLIKTLASLKAEGVGLIVATQDQRLLAIADQVVVLANGAVETRGTSGEIAVRLGGGPRRAERPRARQAH